MLAIDAQALDGSLENPFYDLEDAIYKANEVCSPYYQCNISIQLFPGDHYLLARKRDYYRAIKRDKQL